MQISRDWIRSRTVVYVFSNMKILHMHYSHRARTSISPVDDATASPCFQQQQQQQQLQPALRLEGSLQH